MSTRDPDNDDETVTIPREDKYHKGILATWAKDNCKYAPVSFNSRNGSYTLTIPADVSKYEVKNFFKYVTATIRKQSARDAQDFFNVKKENMIILLR